MRKEKRRSPPCSPSFCCHTVYTCNRSKVERWTLTGWPPGRIAAKVAISICFFLRQHHESSNTALALKNYWVRIVGLSPRWYEHSVDENDLDGETMPKFTNEQIKMAALDRTTLPGLVIGNFKVSVYFVSLSEVADLSKKLRPISLTLSKFHPWSTMAGKPF